MLPLSNNNIDAGQFKKAYPEAKIIGVEGLAEVKKKEGLELNGGEYLSL